MNVGEQAKLRIYNKTRSEATVILLVIDKIQIDLMTKCKTVMTDNLANDREVIVMQLDLGETMMIMMMIIDL